MKNIEWLNNEVEKRIEKIKTDEVSFAGSDYFDEGYIHGMGDVQTIANQLDEPEVLSQELPVIPKFVAEWYESEGKRSSWWNWFYKWGRDESRSDLETKTIKWMQDYNEEKIVDMFLHGYTVEEEQKYYVLDKDNIIMIGKVNNGKVMKRNFDTPFNNFNEPAKERAQLTEQEIKDYDERFWPFAVKVKELEE